MAIEIYDPAYAVCAVDGTAIKGWADAADGFSVSQIADSKTLTEGMGGSSAITFTGKQAATVTFKLMQNAPENKVFERLYDEGLDSKTFRPFTATFHDLINGDVVNMVDGFFPTNSAYARGNAHNESVWTVTFAKVDIKRG